MCYYKHSVRCNKRSFRYALVFEEARVCRRMHKRGFNGFHSTLKSSLNSIKDVFYSTSAASNGAISSPLMVDYLVKSIGFSEREAVAIVTKVRHPFKSTAKPERVVDFLKTSGFDGTQIRNLVAGLPIVLKNNVDKTLTPKIRGFQDFGFSGSDLGLIVSRNPQILGRNPESVLFPALRVLKSLFGGEEHVVGFILQINIKNALTFRSLKQLPANIMLLRSSGVTDERIKVMLSREFPTFCYKWDKKLLKRVEEKLGIPRTSAMFVYGIAALARKSEAMIQSMLQVLRSYGWSETEIKKLLRGNPMCLSMSEKHLRLKLKYFMEDIGCGSDYLSSRPALLSYSMEKRILPRAEIMQTLKDKQLLKYTCALYTYLKMSESKFKERYVLPYKDEFPELYEKMGYSPSKA